MTRLFAAPGAAPIRERLAAELQAPVNEIQLDSRPISIYCGSIQVEGSSFDVIRGTRAEAERMFAL